MILVGFDWAASDDDKLAISFNMTKKDFGCFLDLREIASQLGYLAGGLGSLTEVISGSAPRKSKSTTMSNWERHNLTRTQMAYASWDVFTCGLILRQLRLWHANHEACSACGKSLGEHQKCSGCGNEQGVKKFSSYVYMIVFTVIIKFPCQRCHAVKEHVNLIIQKQYFRTMLQLSSILALWTPSHYVSALHNLSCLTSPLP